MAIGFNIQFRINEKTESRVIRLTDTSTGFTLTKGNFSIVHPDGSTILHTDFNSPDITTAGAFYDFQASTDVYNNVLTGQYVITFVAQDAGLNIQTIQRTIDFNWIKPTKSIVNLSDTMIPEVKFQDSTAYLTSGSFTGVLTSRTFNVLMPTTSAVTGTTVTAVSNIIDAVVSTNYYEGVYTPKSDVVVTYTHNTLSTSLTVLYTALLEKEFSIKKAPTRLELVTRINTFRAQIDAYKELNDTQFETLSEVYDILMALYMHLIERAQNFLLDGSQDILVEILNILDTYTAYTYQSGPISAFYIQPYGLGTVSSVGLTMPTGFTVSNSPVTTSGVLGVVFTAGYSIPTTTKQSNWDDAYTWVAAFPTQTGNTGKFLTTDGSTLSWTTNPLGTVTSVGLSAPTGFSVGSSPVTSSGTIALSFSAGYSLPSDATQATWTAKQNALSGTGFVKISGTTISYDSSTYYLASNPSGYITGITSGMVTSALGFTPYNATNPNGYITGITSGMVISALGFTPYSSSNPNGYISSNQNITLTGAVTGSGATAITTTLANSVVGIANLSATGTASSTTYLRGDNTWATVSASGSVTSVGLSMPSAFTVTNSPVTSAGTLTVVGAGTAAQYITGDGSLATFPSSIASASQMTTFGRNSTGATLYRGTIVYISGSTGNVPNFSKAQASGEGTSARTFGVIKDDIANNADGYVVSIGSIDNLDTRTAANGATHPFTSDTLADGDTVYLSPTTAGYITNVKPSAPNHLVYIGKVIRTSPTNGTIVYQIQNGFELDEIHDVQVGSYVNKDILYRDTTTNLWKNDSISTVLGYTAESTSNKGVAGGYASLDGGGLVPSTQLPSYVDDVLEYANLAALPATGTTGKIYVTLDDNKIYRWSGSAYIEVSPSVGTIWGGITGTLSNQTDLNTALSGKQAAISLTTTGSSGASTFITNTLNIPTYTLSGLGGQASSTNLTSLSGLTFASTSFVKMTAAGTFALDTAAYTTNLGTVTSVAALTLGTTGTDVSSTVANGTTAAVITLNIPTASASNRGALSSTDWSTFNGKQASSTNLTSLSGLTFASTSFVKMTAAGTFALDTTAYTANLGTVTSVAALTLGTTGTDLSSTVANGTTAAVITLNVPTASAANRGALSSTDWSTFNNKQATISLTTTGSSGAATFITNTLNIPTYTLAGLGGQASSTNLTSLSGLTYASASFVKMTAAGTFALDTNTYYLSSNPSGYTSNTGTVTSVAALTIGTTGTDLASTVANGSTAAVITLNVPTASATNRGALSSADWTTFNSKQGTITLTTTGTTGAATLVGNTLNIPQYVGGVSSFNTRTGAITLTSGDVTGALTYTPVTDARTLTINGVTYDLTANRSWTVSGGGGTNVGSFSRTIQNFTATAAQTTFTISGGYTAEYIDVYVNGVRLTGADYTASNGTTVVMGAGLLVGDIVDVAVYGGIALSGTAPISFNTTTGAISISQASTSTNGYLSSTDWNTFNGKQGTITLTTTGSSGAATLVGNTLNIPQYSGGSASAAGSNTEIQFNNAGAFGASANLTWDGTSIVATNQIATGGSASYGAFSGTFTSGVVLDHNSGNGRLSVKNTDGFQFFNGGVGSNLLAELKGSGELDLNGNLIIGTGTVVPAAVNAILQIASSAAGYVQAYIHNDNAGTGASSDIACYPDNGLDTSGWIDMGITSSIYSDANFLTTGANEGYIFMSAPSGASKTGNLVFATDSTGTQNYFQWYVGGFGQAKSAFKMQLKSTALDLSIPLNSTVATGTAPFTVASTTQVANLFATKAATVSDASIGITSLSATGTPSATTYLRGDNTWATVSGGSGSPAGTTGQVQYNNAGAFGGAALVKIDADGNLNLGLDTAPPIPAANTVTIFNMQVGGRNMLSIVGPAGVDNVMQTHIARNGVSIWTAAGNSTTITAFGNAALGATGNATAANITTTNIQTRMKRLEYLVTTAAATAVAGFRGAANQWWMGNTANSGGFHFICRFGPATGVATTTSRLFVGMTSSTAAPTDVQPSSLTNFFGVGYDAADATLQFMHNAASTTTKISLTGFTVPTADRTAMYELAMFVAPNSTSLNYTVIDLSTGTSLSGTVTTNLPTANTLLSPRGWCSAGGTSSVIGIALASLYLETDY